MEVRMIDAPALEKNPAVDDNFVILDRHDTIRGYADSYGARLTEWYEDDRIIILPFWPLNIDLDFLQTLSLPETYQKLGNSEERREGEAGVRTVKPRWWT